MQLDFSQITDDQLIDLIRAACAEAALRGTEARLAAEAAVLDEATKARLAREAASMAASAMAHERADQIARAAKDAAERKAAEEKTARNWDYKDEVGKQISDLFRPTRKIELKVWTRGGDQRIYAGGGYNDNDIEYYHTGNSHNRPRSIKRSLSDSHLTKQEYGAIEPQLVAALAGICEKWTAITIPIPAYQPAKEEAA